MKHLNLSEIATEVLAVLKADHLGRERAIKREALLPIIRARMADDLLSDRQLRKAVAKCEPEMCSCSRGYYSPMTIGERKLAASIHIKRGRSEFKRAEEIANGYPELEQMVQMELPR